MSTLRLVFTEPCPQPDGTRRDLVVGSANFYTDVYGRFGESYVSFEDDLTSGGGHCDVPLSQVPALIKWLQQITTEETLRRFQGSITFNASWPTTRSETHGTSTDAE